MGCDIHMNVEVRRDGRWHYVDPTDESKYVPGYFHHWNDRSYITFAVLAGVRADEDDPPPISEPRGYPKDADPITVMDPDRDEDGNRTGRHQNHGDHSHTWLTLDEVFAYNWDVKYREHGVVGMSEYVRCLREKDTPRSWSGWVGGQGVRVMTPAQAGRWLRSAKGRIAMLDNVVNGDGEQPWLVAHQYNVKWSWTVRLADRCESFLSWARSLPAMLGADPKDIRLVFSFDS